MRLQPWRYLSEVAKGLCEQGHSVSVISDVEDGFPNWDSPIRFLGIKSVTSPVLWPNYALSKALISANSDVLLWHVGLAAFLYQALPAFRGIISVGIFTSPIYSMPDFKQIGLRKVLRNYPLSAVHLASALAPRWFLRSRMCRSGLSSMVVQTQTLRCQLQDSLLWTGSLQVIPPGVDPLWGQVSHGDPAELRQSLGFTRDERIVLYFGSPAPLRGLPLLIQAFQIARQSDPALELVVLSRRRSEELKAEAVSLDNLLKKSPARDHIHLVDGLLSQEELAGYITACDAVALPFELVPSDAPLSLLEAATLGKPVVTTRLGCLPELVPPELRFLAEPSGSVSLAQQLILASKRSAVEQAARPPVRSWEQVSKEWSDWVQCLS